jgi:alkylhydroperoxidase family enzyme
MRRSQEFAERLRNSVLRGKGETAPALRQAVAARGAELGGHPEAAGAGEISPGLRDFVDQTALHAYRITDQEIADLRAAGFSEDTIFEIAVSTAVGAGLARLERGLAALAGDPR